MAVAVDREQHQIGLPRAAGEQIQMVLDTAVMMQKVGTGLLGGRAQMRHLMRMTADIDPRDAVKPRL